MTLIVQIALGVVLGKFIWVFVKAFFGVVEDRIRAAAYRRSQAKADAALLADRRAQGRI